VKHRHIIAVATAVLTAGLAACGSSSAPSSSSSGPAVPSSGTLNIWLMSGSAPVALSGSGVGQTCNSSGVTTTTTGTWVTGFEQANPGWTVDITCQGWSGIVAKVTSALASSSPPDALEMGNTQVTGFADTGGLADLTSDSFPNESTWLAGLKGAGTYQNKLFGIPYYAGGRLVIYNTAMFTAAGITGPPTTTAQLITDGQAIQTAEKSTANFCSLWLPGESWYQIFSYLADANTGAASADPIASYANGKWAGTFESSTNEQALTALKSMRDQISSCSAPDQTDTTYDVPMIHQTAAMVMQPSWAEGVVTSEAAKLTPPVSASDFGVFPIPGANGPAPVFLGGSNLGVAQKSPNKAMAVKFLQYVTDNENMSDLTTLGGVTPNTTSLFGLCGAAGSPQYLSCQGAKSTWFTPTSPGESTVENDKVYEDMLASIFTGQKTVDQAAKAADTLLNQYLNAPAS
jgi:N,N'-diacetylchitobiose transport system substrate-binding protein